MRKGKKLAALLLTAVMGLSVLAGCGAKSVGKDSDGNEIVKLIWYQIGDPAADMPRVLEKVNEYTKEKIGVVVEINQIGWGDYNKKMQVINNTGGDYDLAFTCSWANDYLSNAEKGAFLPLDDLLKNEGKELYDSVDQKFWEAAKVKGVTYAVPHEKEIGNTPMWVFNKELVEKYDIPYEDVKTLEDLEPYLALIKENEPEYTPFYLTKEFSLPAYFDKIQDPIGIEFGDDSLTVQNIYETDKMKSELETIRKYYKAGYINKDAATASDDKSVKRFITKGDGQPYAEIIWSKDLGYDVVATPIMDTQVTNASARGAMTAISKTSKHPEKAMEFLNLVNTDEYLRNLLNYGFEGEHYEVVPVTDEEMASVKDQPYVLKNKVKVVENNKNYSVAYWVQGGLFSTYVLYNEPADKWAYFKQFNDESLEAPSFGFDFDASNVLTQMAGFRNVLDEYGKSLNTGSVDPDEYLPKMIEKLKSTGIDDVIAEMQKQIDEWKTTK